MRTIATINPVIGDESFVARFGRMPTAFDDVRTRVATHVGYAARLLRDRESTHPTRLRLLDALDDYAAAGEFPASETDRDLAPTFLDPHSGVRCAVAHLVETTAGTAIMVELDRDHHNDYIADLADDPRFVTWVATSGLTHEELAIIQPSYPDPPPPDFLYVIAAEADASVHDASPTPDPLSAMALVDGRLRYVTRNASFAGELLFDGEAKLGITNGSHPAYDASLRIGHYIRFRPETFVYEIGLDVSSFGPDVPRAWTIPVDVSYRLDIGGLTYGVHAGPRFTVAGDRDIGWNVGTDIRVNYLFGHHEASRFDESRTKFPDDLIVAFDVTGLDDHVMLGITIGVGTPRGRAWGDK